MDICCQNDFSFNKNQAFRDVHSKTPEISMKTRRKKFISFPSVRHEDEIFKTCVTESCESYKRDSRKKHLKVIPKIDLVSCLDVQLALEKLKNKEQRINRNVNRRSIRPLSIRVKNAKNNENFCKRIGLSYKKLVNTQQNINAYTKKRSKLREKINLVSADHSFLLSFIRSNLT
jgi:hypothetical protein